MASKEVPYLVLEQAPSAACSRLSNLLPYNVSQMSERSPMWMNDTLRAEERMELEKKIYQARRDTPEAQAQAARAKEDYNRHMTMSLNIPNALRKQVQAMHAKHEGQASTRSVYAMDPPWSSKKLRPADWDDGFRKTISNIRSEIDSGVNFDDEED